MTYFKFSDTLFAIKMKKLSLLLGIVSISLVGCIDMESYNHYPSRQYSYYREYPVRPYHCERPVYSNVYPHQVIEDYCPTRNRLRNLGYIN